MDEEGKLFAMVTRKDLEKRQDYPSATLDKAGRLCVAAAVGPAINMEERVALLAKAGVDALVVDTAHGHSKGVANTIHFIKKEYPHISVVAGNVATPEAVEFLAKAGADAVKSALDPDRFVPLVLLRELVLHNFLPFWNALPSPRKTTFVSLPMAVLNIQEILPKPLPPEPILSCSGRFLPEPKNRPAKSFCRRKTWKSYRGMGSISAMKQGGKERYGQAETLEAEKFVPEGIEGRTLFKGSVQTEIFQLVGGLKSSMGYQGSATIPELQKKRSLFASRKHRFKKAIRTILPLPVKRPITD